MEDNKRTVSALASLIKFHHQRLDAYALLWGTTSSDEIRSLCKHQIDLSIQFADNLSVWSSAYDNVGKPWDYNVDRSLLFQARLFFSFNPEKTIISRCEELERKTLKACRLALAFLPTVAASDLRSQAKVLEPMVQRLQEAVGRSEMVSSLAVKQVKA